ncbi:unnamed protein product [Penicillium salamii]|nr:unnamed protein product [Penicillium salamii]
MRESRDNHTKMILKYLDDNKKILFAIQVLYATPQRTKNWFDWYPKQTGPLHVAAW